MEPKNGPKLESTSGALVDYQTYDPSPGWSARVSVMHWNLFCVTLYNASSQLRRAGCARKKGHGQEELGS